MAVGHTFRQEFFGFGMALVMLWPVYVAGIIGATAVALRTRRWRWPAVIAGANALFFVTCGIVFFWVADLVISPADPTYPLVLIWGWLAILGGPVGSVVGLALFAVRRLRASRWGWRGS